jgi:hypothetical protein
MNIAELYAEMESDQEWRQKEIRFFQNRLAHLSSEEQKNQFRRALILILYAHFEGFCKFALTLYVNAINSEGIPCEKANYAIAAASLANLFMELRNPDKKCPEFRRTLPDDAKLHKFARDREFVERFTDFINQPVLIPEHVVDTESNLKPVVLRKNLYRLGFPHTQFDGVQGNVDKLLNYRNLIAHGETQTGIKQNVYEDLRVTTYTIMDEIKRVVMEALQEKLYLRSI